MADLHFASPIPIWLAALLALAVAAVAFFSYRRPLVPLTLLQRVVLMSLRALTIGLVLVFLCRPTITVAPSTEGDSVVAVLLDVSRSMRIADAGNATRLQRAISYLQGELLPSLQGRYAADLYQAGATLEPASADDLSGLTPAARRTELLQAVETLRNRLHRRRVAGIVVISDGGDTTGRPFETEADGPPVFTVGIGSPESPRDREVVAIAAGEPRLDQSTIDVRVSAVSHGFGRDPFELRLLANGRLLDTRTVAPAADGSPLDQIFTVSPDAVAPTVYTAEISAAGDEPIEENNTRSILVGPSGRARRVLMLAGAPGYDYSFANRALSADSGLEIDSVVRKGKNETGEDTFLVQARGERGAPLARGFPATREALFAYDTIVLANLEGGFFTRAQLTQLAEFVGERGGGLLVFGSQSFAERSLTGTPLEEVLPVELNDRRGLLRTTFDVDRSTAHHTVILTPEGQTHPVMRVAANPAESAEVWRKLPPLAAAATLGAPRPGATVLAATAVPSGGVYPLLAVQRYGRGRSMVFAGEASWRWRMMRPSTDRTYEFFWRQAVRWLASPAPDPVTISVPDASEPNDAIEIAIEARDAAFAPADDAAIDARLTLPGGEVRSMPARRDAAAAGRFIATVRADTPGLHRVQTEARRGSRVLGAADRWFFVGGSEREFADPRLNEPLLRRLARDSGGRYARVADADVASWLQASAPRELEPERREVWHAPWTFALVIGLLSAEWVLRRRWGLR